MSIKISLAEKPDFVDPARIDEPALKDDKDNFWKVVDTNTGEMMISVAKHSFHPAVEISKLPIEEDL